MQEEDVFPDTDTTDKLKSWLRTALEAYDRDENPRRAFRPFGYYIGQDADLAGDLGAAYESRPAEARDRWRIAVRELLAEHGGDVAWTGPTETLIDLATSMPAPDVLEVLPGLIRGRQGDDAERMANRVVSAATALASSTKAALKCLQRICTSPLFAPHHAGFVLTALCRVDPDHWVEHVVDLEPAMQRLEKMIKNDPGTLRHYAHLILVGITVSGIEPRMLDHLHSQLMAHHGIYSNWLYRAWFVGKESLLDRGNHHLRVRDNPSACVRFADIALSDDYLGARDKGEFNRLLEKLAADNELSPEAMEVAHRLGQPCPLAA